jgi:hypothetical protein
MSKRKLVLVALHAGVMALVPAVGVAGTAEPSTVNARTASDKVLIGFELHFTGPDTTSGTFVASGAVQDAGESNVKDFTLVPFGRQDRARLAGN